MVSQTQQGGKIDRRHAGTGSRQDENRAPGRYAANAEVTVGREAGILCHPTDYHIG